jgi:hypothetical protein
MRAVFPLVVLMMVGACGVGRHVQKGINAYNASDLNGAMVIWNDLDGRQAEMNEKGRVRYLVYRGLTHHRLNQRGPAVAYLKQGQLAYHRGDPRWLPTHVVSEMQAALQGVKPAVVPAPSAAPQPPPPPPPPEGATEIQ